MENRPSGTPPPGSVVDPQSGNRLTDFAVMHNTAPSQRCGRVSPSARREAMRRREFITSLASTITAWPFAGLAQTASKVYRIGFLSSRPLPAESSVGAAILRGFARHGYVPDRNMALETRAAEGHPERLPQLANDLVANNVDVILTFSFPAATAAKNATTTIPIVATRTAGDAVATALVRGFSRPHANGTGRSPTTGWEHVCARPLDHRSARTWM